MAYISDREQPYEYEVLRSPVDGSERRKLRHFHGYIEQVRFAPITSRSFLSSSQRGRLREVKATSISPLWTGRKFGRLEPIDKG